VIYSRHDLCHTFGTRLADAGVNKREPAGLIIGTCRKSPENNSEPWKARTSDPPNKNAATN